MTKLREKMRMDIELKGYSPSTLTSYLRHVKNFAIYYSKSPDLLGTDEIKEYLHILSSRKNIAILI